MDIDERISLLQDIPVFGGIEADVIRLLIAQSTPLSIKANEFVFREGDRSSSMYIIESGEVAIIKRNDDLHYLLRRMKEGDCIGEMALFDFLPRSASAFVLQDANMLSISSANLMEIYKLNVEQFALLQMNMGREVTRRLRMADERCFHHRVEEEIQEGTIEYFDIDIDIDVDVDVDVDVEIDHVLSIKPIEKL